MFNKILFITLSNIGDAILTLPVLDTLKQNFPEAKIIVMTGPRPKDIFLNNPYVDRVIIYNKQERLREKISLFRQLKKESFDIVIDLRNSLFGILLSSRYRVSPLLSIPKDVKHAKESHMYKLYSALRSYGYLKKPLTKSSVYISPEDKEYIEEILRINNIRKEENLFVVAAGARSQIKRWQREKFVELITLLIKDLNVQVILVGSQEDACVNKYITENVVYTVLDLTGKTTLSQLAYLLKKARLLVTNDSAVLHMASYLDVPVVAIFGPTNEARYGPWSCNSVVIKKDISCRPCQKARCRFKTLDCMRLIGVQDVFRRIKEFLGGVSQSLQPAPLYRRILIVRTDRIGDVVLSTPVIKALRDSYPDAYIAMMVSAHAKPILDGNPYLDKVIVYDKRKRHRSWWNSMRFCFDLRKIRFDLALILHPTNRVHLITFFAGIPRRIGYNRKFGFLLTDRIRHLKQQGEKHELEYNLDLVRYLGIQPKDKSLFMPINPQSERWVDELMQREGIKESDRILAIHPGASCPSKLWPCDRFAQVADRLIEKYGFKVLVVAGTKDVGLAQDLIQHMHHPAINLAGKTSILQLASLLKRCQLFISNDSGPVHIASAVSTPVISIFGRNQKGLSPKRWGPIGKKAHFIHKEVGCIECLAHNCKRDFACLKAITVEDVLGVADSILNQESQEVL
ncbi:MAG: lipopolysaccharide heptosyltransferase II [Candidatus Omnitrophica bacterium]|nr:lipopolysaccharide heptosyltransferase II [Candidatus Omnitrophota bacterium]